MDHLNYQHLFYFMVVCQTGGFTKAGQRLQLSQSSISAQVHRLEEVFGQKLLNRSTRKVEITEAGRVALKYAETIFSSGNELLDLMKHRPSKSKSHLRIGALGSLSRNLQAAFLDPILNRTDTRFSVTTGDSKKLMSLLQEHTLDIVLSTHPTGQEFSQLYTHQLATSPLCIVVHPSYRRKKVSLKNTLEKSILFLPSHSLESRSDFDHFIESNKIDLSPQGEVDDIALLRLLALSKKGIVVIPKIGILNDLEKNNLVILHEFKNISQKFYAITRQKRFPNPIIEELMKRLKHL